MEIELVVAFEQAGDLGVKGGVGVQACHFVFVFVSHQLEQAFGDRLRQAQ